jgi:hypothetical protein
VDDDHGSPDQSAEDVLARLFRSGRTNAAIAWLLVGVLAVTFVESILGFDRLWMDFVAATAAVVLVPPVAHRDWRVMLPWEPLVLALLPVLVRALLGGELGTFAYYLSVSGLALIITVELHVFTELRMTHWFAVIFVSMTTMASVAAWTVVRWTLDRWLGTSFLTDNEALMTEWAAVAVAGLAAGYSSTPTSSGGAAGSGADSGG